MAMTLLEKILAAHSGKETVSPGEILDVNIDARVARDFGGANVVKNLRDFQLDVKDPDKTLFTFDCNPGGSDQKYAVNQHICRLYARENGIKVFDINSGIGTHILMDRGMAYPGSTAVSTDSHANILGAIGAFGQGMGDMDIAAAWHNGKIWFKVPLSVKIVLEGDLPAEVSSKDIVLNLLNLFGANSLLGYSVEIAGDPLVHLTLDDRITISSMATEMGAIIILFGPSPEILDFCSAATGRDQQGVFADEDARYLKTISMDVSKFRPMVSLPGEPHDTVDASEVIGTKIDSAFIGSCTNGRMSDMRAAATVLRGRKVAPGVVLKIVPSTDDIWRQCLDEGLMDIFKKAGALVANAGCAGCAAGQVGQNGQGEITISTGNRNFPGKQGKGSVYLASPEITAASAVAGFITIPGKIPADPATFMMIKPQAADPGKNFITLRAGERKQILEGRVWIIKRDNIDTDMIYHNRYLAVTELKEMGKYTFDNLTGSEDFSRKARKGDIIITAKNFGCGSSRQQAVDCFRSLGIAAIIAESFGAIYERNAINSAFPVITAPPEIAEDLHDGDVVSVNLKTGVITNVMNGKIYQGLPFSEIQMEIYRRGGLLVN